MLHLTESLAGLPKKELSPSLYQLLCNLCAPFSLSVIEARREVREFVFFICSPSSPYLLSLSKKQNKKMMKDRLYIILYSIDVIPPSWPPLTTAPSSDDEPHKTSFIKRFYFSFSISTPPPFGLQFNGGITTMSFTTSKKKKKKAGRVQTTLQEEESQEGEKKKSWGSQSFEGCRASTSLLLH